MKTSCNNSEYKVVEVKKIRKHMLKKYVDDCFVALGRLRLGTRWSRQEQALIWSMEDEEEDRRTQQTTTVQKCKLTAKVCLSWIQRYG